MKKLFHDSLALLSPRERRRFYLLCMADFFTTLLDLAFLALLVLMVGLYTGSFSPPLPFWLQPLFDKERLYLGGLFLLLFVLKNVLVFLLLRAQYRFVYEVASRLSGEELGSYLAGDYARFVNTDSSVHTRAISHQPVEFAHHVLRGWQQFINNSVLVVLTLLVLLLFNAPLFGMLMAMLLPAIALLWWITKKKLDRVRAALRHDRQKAMQYLQESLSGYIEINIFRRAAFFTRRYLRRQGLFNEGLADQLVLQHLPSRMMEVFAVLGLFLLLLAYQWLGGPDSLLLLIAAFVTAAYKIIPGLGRVINSLQQVRLFSYTVEELRATRRGDGMQEESEAPPLRSVRFEQVGFHLEGRRILGGVNMNLIPGSFTCLVGASGIGKTTVLHLLLGFLENEAGHIFINDQRLDAKGRRAFWPRISYSPQQAFLLHDTLQHNIALSDEADLPRLWKTIETTGLVPVVEQLPGGMDVLISEEGRNLSGGQRKRVLMARALYKEADLYIFDEPFNELDRPAMESLAGELKKLADAGKMVLVVSHDTAVREFCTQIIRMDG